MFSSIKFYIYFAVMVIVTSAISYLSYTLYQKESELSDYREQVAHLEANNLVLKGNLESIQNTLEFTKLQYKNYRELHSTANSEVVDLRYKNRDLDKQVKGFHQKLDDIKKELSVADSKLLESQIPSTVIDAYNANSMLNEKVTSP